MKFLFLAVVLCLSVSCGALTNKVPVRNDAITNADGWTFFTIKHPSGGVLNCVSGAPGGMTTVFSCDWPRQ